MFHPELRLLRCFAAIAETQSITRAAAKLNLSQPTVSGQLRELEQAIGFALFDRTSRAVSLTPQGKALLPLVHEVLEGSERVRHKVEELQARQSRHFRLGAAIYTFDLPERGALLEAFSEAMPGFSFTVDNRLQSDQVRDLMTGSLDASLLLGIPIAGLDQASSAPKPGMVENEAVYPDSLERILLRRVPIGLVVPEGSPLAQYEIVPKTALEGQTIAMLTFEHGHAFIDPMDAFLRACGAHLHYPAEGTAFAIERYAVRHGVCAIGIGWFPCLPGTCPRPVEDMDFFMDLAVVISPGANLAARQFFDFAARWRAARA